MNIKWTITMIAIAALIGGVVQAQEPDDPPRSSGAETRYQDRSEERERAREQWESMSDEERAAVREEQDRRRAENRARRESMSDEERTADRAEQDRRRAENRARWESMSDEQRDRFMPGHPMDFTLSSSHETIERLLALATGVIRIGNFPRIDIHPATEASSPQRRQ